jgi:aromatase
VCGDRVRFLVTTPPDDRGRSFSYRVERVADPLTRTVYSRRYDSPDLRYSHVWFAYTPEGAGTRMRCVVDFELADGARTDETEAAALMEQGLRRNMAGTARRIEESLKSSKGARTDG